MKFCCCVGLNTDRLPILKKHGLEYCEPAISAIASADDEKFNEFLAKKNELGLKCASANGMFPGDIPLLEGKAGYGKISEYLDHAFSRCQALGVPVGILGSGKAREIPEGMSKEEATERFCALLSDVVSPYAEKYGIIVGIEELCAQECNFINSCKEAMEIIRAVNVPNVKLLLDYYHAIHGGDTLEELESYNDNIVHVHISSTINDRMVPMDCDLDACREFFSMLKRIDYKGAVSIEARFGDFDSDIETAVKTMNAAL